MADRILLSGDAQTGTDKVLLSGDEQTGTDSVEISYATYLEPATAGAITFFGQAAEIDGPNPIQVNVAVREVLRSTGTGATEIQTLVAVREVLRSSELDSGGRKRWSFM